jgi:hypothetical protein
MAFEMFWERHQRCNSGDPRRIGYDAVISAIRRAGIS